MKVFTVVGNRPQFIKAAPLSGALLAAGVDEVVLHTGQHWFHVMSQVFFDQLGLAEPKYRLDLHTSSVDTMQPATGRYTFNKGTVYNLLADAFIADHGDVHKPEVANALAQSIATTG